MTKLSRIFLCAALGLFFQCALSAPTPVLGEFFSDDYDAAKVLDIVLGESKVVPVNNPVRVAIGDPATADVAGASKQELIVAGKKAGETNLQIWDQYGQRELTIRVFSEDLEKLKSRLEDLLATASLFRSASRRGRYLP
jgi:Flp pilus assembly secretin CpaC